MALPWQTPGINPNAQGPDPRGGGGLLGNMGQLGLGLLAQSGYSTMPTTFGQAVAGAMQQQRQQQLLQMQMAAAKQRMEAQRMEMEQAKKRQAAMERMSGLLQDPTKAYQADDSMLFPGEAQPEGWKQPMTRQELQQGLLSDYMQVDPRGAMGVMTQKPQQEDLPSGMWRNPQTGRVEYMPAYIEGQRQMRQSGAPQTVVNNNIGPDTPGRKKADEAYAADFVKWRTGGFADAQKNVSQLDEQLKLLESGKVQTGPLVGAVPDAIKTITNPELLSLRESVEEVVQRNLREILGAQFTEKEGERLISRAFNERLPTEMNAKRLRRLINQVRSAAKAKQEAAAYFDQNGTLTGFQGKTYSAADFDPDALFSEDSKPANSGGWSIQKVD